MRAKPAPLPPKREIVGIEVLDVPHEAIAR
jgi:hypothetical protein